MNSTIRGRLGPGLAPTGVLAGVERRAGVTATGLLLGVVVVVSWLLARVVHSQPMTLIAYGLFVITGMSAVNARRRLPVTAERTGLPLRVREGQLVSVDLALAARRRVTGLIIEDELPAQLGASPRLPIAVLPGGRDVEHSYRFVPRTRGVYRIGPLVGIVGDAFGLTRRRVVLCPATEIIVHPRTEQVHDRVLSREWEDPPVRPPIAKPWPTGFEFYGMRDYQSGDDPRRIMWRAAARTWDPVTGIGRYMVRESEQGITDRVTLVLDTDRRHHSAGSPSETFEAAVRAVASLGLRHLKDGFSVTIHAADEKIADALRGSRSQLPMLDALAAVQRGSATLTTVLQQVLASPRAHTHIVVVTPEVDDASARALRLMLDRGASVMVVLVRTAESDPASARRVGALGCNFVELHAEQPLDLIFATVHGSGARR